MTPQPDLTLAEWKNRLIYYDIIIIIVALQTMSAHDEDSSKWPSADTDSM